jgi:hypothetical protein
VFHYGIHHVCLLSIAFLRNDGKSYENLKKEIKIGLAKLQKLTLIVTTQPYFYNRTGINLSLFDLFKMQQ